MPTIAVTGHVRLAARECQLIFEALRSALREYAGPDLRGVTCLARGADQLFAEAVLAARGRLEVVLPAADYRTAEVSRADQETFDRLLNAATTVRTMPYEKSTRIAFLAASVAMLSDCDVLFAIWDGGPSKSIGDTAHVVSVAREQGIPVQVFWPTGSAATDPVQPGGRGCTSF